MNFEGGLKRSVPSIPIQMRAECEKRQHDGDGKRLGWWGKVCGRNGDGEGGGKINLVWTTKGPMCGTSIVVQGLRLTISSAGGHGSIAGWRTRSHIPQLEFTCCN